MSVMFVEARHFNNGVVGVVHDLERWCNGHIYWKQHLSGKVALQVSDDVAHFGDWIVKRGPFFDVDHTGENC